MRRCAARSAITLLLLAQVPLAFAQGAAIRDTAALAAATAQEEPVRTGWSRFFDPDDGQFDLSYFLEKPHGFLPVPIIVTEPAIGYGAGMAGMFLRPRREAGEAGWSRPNISALGAFATENGTWGGFAGDSSRWMDDRLRTLVGVATGRINLDFYGLGLGPASLDQGLRYSLTFTGMVAQANWQLAPKSPWAVGLRYIYADVDPTLRDDPLFPNLAERARVKISAPMPVLEYDTRDNILTPTRGIYSESSVLLSRKDFGATADFERFMQVLMGFYPVGDDVILGARGNYDWSSDGTPFFMRPFIQLRGVPVMRYQGDQAASVEIEARWRFHGRWSVVGFAGAGTARSDERFSATQNVGSGGAGIRYEIARKFGMDVGIDVAHSPGTTAFYLVVGNSWFRP